MNHEDHLKEIEFRGEYVSWPNTTDLEPEEVRVTLDGDFSPEELEAIAWKMRNP